MGDGGQRATQPKHPTGGCGRFPQRYCDHESEGVVVTDQADTPDPIGEWLAAGDKATAGPWRWMYPGSDSPELRGMDGDGTEGYEPDVIAADHSGECGCRSACSLTLTVSDEDAEFIAASRNVVPAVHALVAELAAARDREAKAAEAVARADMAVAHGDAEAARDRLAEALAALSQSEPTKETP